MGGIPLPRFNSDRGIDRLCFGGTLVFCRGIDFQGQDGAARIFPGFGFDDEGHEMPHDFIRLVERMTVRKLPLINEGEMISVNANQRINPDIGKGFADFNFLEELRAFFGLFGFEFSKRVGHGFHNDGMD